MPGPDVIGISFARTPGELWQAIDEIRAAAKDRKRPGIVVKIETARAVASLPDLLLESLRHFPVGIMIARGDLAVEVDARAHRIKPSMIKQPIHSIVEPRPPVNHHGEPGIRATKERNR